MLKVVHYLNQFYGGIGGEEKADIEPQVVPGPVGPGLALQETFDVVATVICGDNFFAENIAEAGQTVLTLIKQFSPDLVLAGPAFNAGRYGVACGEVCKLTTAVMGIPAVTAMYEENPGVSLYQSDVVIVKAGITARTMKKTVEQMSLVGQKLLSNEEITPAADHYFSQGIKKNIVSEYSGAHRAVNMLLAKLQK
ncbi:MAG: glycine/betaine/sarcosine/D-proline family reductase selenoprotein B, partial [Firmicutes bacterium]|nr:glycine/betaine/sarcosine/D-proline family reductase selenoprotein B [Bacillota bacterium]